MKVKYGFFQASCSKAEIQSSMIFFYVKLKGGIQFPNRRSRKPCHQALKRSHKTVTRNLLFLLHEMAEIIVDSSGLFISLDLLHVGVMKWFHEQYLVKSVPWSNILTHRRKSIRFPKIAMHSCWPLPKEYFFTKCQSVTPEQRVYLRGGNLHPRL